VPDRTYVLLILAVREEIAVTIREHCNLFFNAVTGYSDRGMKGDLQVLLDEAGAEVNVELY
jgi:hypothetical protein